MNNITINKIYAKNKKYFTTYAPEELSPVDIRTNNVLNTKYLGLITTTDHPKGIYIDLSHIFTEQAVGRSTTWHEFTDGITPHMIDSYKVAGSGLNDADIKQPLNIQLMTSPEFNISYCDVHDPSVRDKKYSKFDLHDLVVSKKSAYLRDVEDVHLENCIVSVNGIVSKTIVYNNELYIHNGAMHLWDTNKATSINMFMSDVTPLGGMTRVPLSACKLTYKNVKSGSMYDDSDVLYSDVLISLPTEYDLSNYTVVLCIAGKCDMPDEVSIHNSTTIRISPYKMQMALRLLEIQAAQAGYIGDTEVYTPLISPSEYIRTLGNSELSDIYDGIYLIHNSNVFVRRSKLIDEIGWYTKYHNDRPGICVRTSDRSWMSYATLEYNDMYFSQGVRWPHEVTQLTADVHTNQYGIKTIDHPLVEQYTRTHRLSAYEMVHLTC